MSQVQVLPQAPKSITIDGEGMKDVRVLCQQCINDYRDAGYKVYVLRTQRERCDKCNRSGVVCEIKPPKYKNAQK